MFSQRVFSEGSQRRSWCHTGFTLLTVPIKGCTLLTVPIKGHQRPIKAIAYWCGGCRRFAIKVTPSYLATALAAALCMCVQCAVSVGWLLAVREGCVWLSATQRKLWTWRAEGLAHPRFCRAVLYCTVLYCTVLQEAQQTLAGVGELGAEALGVQLTKCVQYAYTHKAECSQQCLCVSCHPCTPVLVC